MAASVEHGLNNSAFIPPLESGDRLTRHEFERRYTAMPYKKAELIEGVVYMTSPLRFRSHGQPHGNLIVWLGNYKVSTLGVALGENATVRLDLDNEPQPDVLRYTNIYIDKILKKYLVYLGTITKLLLIYISKCIGINKNTYQKCQQ